MVYDVFHFLSIPLLFPYIKKLDNPFERRGSQYFSGVRLVFKGDDAEQLCKGEKCQKIDSLI